LTTGELDNLEAVEALSISEALGADLLVLFLPPVSRKQGHIDPDSTPT